jgi:hypothetical protein
MLQASSELLALGFHVKPQSCVAAVGGAREAVKALIVANGFLEEQIAKLQAAVSTGYSRGRFDMPRDRKYW